MTSPTIRTVTLGRGVGELVTSAIGFGAMGLTAFYGDLTPEKEALDVLRTAYDLGVRHFDTAQVYRREVEGVVHYNEELVGKFLATLSEEEKVGVTVATKYYPKPRFTEDEFIRSTKESAARLGVESIDLYYFHRILPESVAPVATWMGAAKKLVASGLIKRIGLSEASPKVIQQANEIHPITCVQQEWSLFARDLEDGIVPICRELGVGIVSYSPVGRGFLAGSFSAESKPDDWRTGVPYLSEENIAKNLKVREEIKAMADAKGCTLAQLCLAWVMAKGSVPIPGTTSIHHLEDNMGAVNVELTAAEIENLGKLGNKVTGARGNDAYMERTYHANI